MTKEKQAIEYIKKYRKLDEELYNNAPKGTVASIATKKCLEFWDMAIKALEQKPILDKIREEIDQYLFQNEFGSEYRKEVSQIIDKYTDKE